MKLLILTQKVDKNDAVLGFFHRWIEEFSKHCESIIIVCLYKGKYNLPGNVRVLSLGKEGGVSRLTYIIRFYTYIFKFRKQYDSVFVHMNQIYVILGGLFWRLTGKKISLWYAHKSVTFSLRIAEKLAHIIFTASGKSFNLKSSKLNVMGHGIDVEKFKCTPKNLDNLSKIVSVGRITKIKGCDIVIKTAAELKRMGIENFSVTFVGDTVTSEDKKYKEELMLLINRLNLDKDIVFKGSLTGKALLREYCGGDIFINPLPTGGVDKVVLEAMASRRVVFSSNEAFTEYFGEYANRLIFSHKDHIKLAEMVTDLIDRGDYQKITEFLHRQVTKKSDIKSLIKVLVDRM